MQLYRSGAELRSARVRDHLVGLRPARRGGVRLAIDPIGLPGEIRLIHDYGHGGAGVPFGWRGADEVVTLARKSLSRCRSDRTPAT